MENNYNNFYNYSGTSNTNGAYGSTISIPSVFNDKLGFYDGKKILTDVKINEETIEIIYIVRSNVTYTTFNANLYSNSHHNSNDISIKEIYGCNDGKLILLKTLYGKIIPEQYIPESYVFEND